MVGFVPSLVYAGEARPYAEVLGSLTKALRVVDPDATTSSVGSLSDGLRSLLESSGAVPIG